MNLTNPLHTIMNPQSIATVGAGNNVMKMGTMQALSIVKDGYKGKVMPVHPREEVVLGQKAYPSVLDLPEAPKLAVLVVPTDQVVPLLDDFGRIGTKFAVIITAGFRETGEEGRVREEKLRETALKYGIRFLGPNCIGILNTQAPLNIAVSPFDGKPGLLGMASQSGTYITQVFGYLRSKGIRFSKAISVGNETSIDIVDALEYLGEDEDTKAISLYIEGIRDGDRFIKTARKITPHKPVLAQYVGGTEAGARAGSSHTGSMAGPDYLYEGVFRQAGVIRVHSVEDLYGHGWALATQPPLKGRRIGVVTNSGGPGTALANTCNAGGLEVPRFSEELQEKLRPHMAAHASSANPVDITFHIDPLDLASNIPNLIIKSKEVDGIVLHGAMGTGFLRDKYPHLKEFLGGQSVEEFAESYKRDFTPMKATARMGVPFLVSSFLDNRDSFNNCYHEADVPVYDSPEKTARAMIALAKYMDISNRKVVAPAEVPSRSAEAAKIIREAKEKGQKALDEYHAKRILYAYGIPVAPEGLVFSEEEALESARSIGFPVALKGCSPDIMHKTEKGLVELNLKNEDEVLRSFGSVRKAAGGEIPVLVSKMIDGKREFVTGMTRFEAFGPIVMFGLGGVFTEVLKDNSFRVAPFSITDAEEMIFDIRAKQMLGAFRGMPAVNISDMSKFLLTMGHIALLHPEISEIDVNPVIISGAEPVAADVLVVL